MIFAPAAARTGRPVSRPWLLQMGVHALALAAVLVLATLLTRMLVPAAPSPLHAWVMLKNLLLPLALLATYRALVQRLEQRPNTEVSWRSAVALLPLGLVLGVALIGAYVALLGLAGVAELAPGSAPASLLDAGNEFFVPWLTAVGEELLFRAVLFRFTERMFGTSVGILLSSAIFGLAHSGNPGATAGAVLALSLGMGVLLACSFASSRNLWLPIGLHMGWNLAEGFVFGLPNSGQLDPWRLASTSVLAGPAWSGGAFGPEASLPLLALCVLCSLAFAFRAVRARRWVSLQCMWREMPRSGSSG